MTVRSLAAFLFACVVLTPNSAAAATTIDREFRYPGDRFALHTEQGRTVVTMSGTSSREFRAGRPDLPWVTEQVRLPEGSRVERIEVLSIDSAPLAKSVT